VVLILIAVAALTNASRSATQVAAAGQAQTQSQRLAKSVSQALLGGPPAFAEVKESADVLARNVRGLSKTARATCRPRRPACSEQVQPLLPLVDRAEKSAGVVLAQQKTLTQVGQSLRTINRQSADLLELAETVSSLKLQQGASSAELSAVGQLVMLTQRIGKSANEFQTMEGVSPEAVFQLGKDLNSFREIARACCRQCRTAPARHQGPAGSRTPAATGQAVRRNARPGHAILANLQGPGGGARRAGDDRGTASRCARPGRCRQALSDAGGCFGSLSIAASVLAVLLMLAGGLGLLRLFVVDQTARSQVAESSAWRPNARSRRPSASTTPTRPPFCG
jgi:twitching motility protein PilJ